MGWLKPRWTWWANERGFWGMLIPAAASIIGGMAGKGKGGGEKSGGGKGWASNPWVQAGLAAAPLVGGVIAGRKDKKAAEQAAGGATFQNLMPIIMAMMQQQQRQQQQNYDLQMQDYQASQPLQAAIRRMAMGLMPTQYTGRE